MKFSFLTTFFVVLGMEPRAAGMKPHPQSVQFSGHKCVQCCVSFATISRTYLCNRSPGWVVLSFSVLLRTRGGHVRRSLWLRALLWCPASCTVSVRCVSSRLTWMSQWPQAIRKLIESQFGTLGDTDACVQELTSDVLVVYWFAQRDGDSAVSRIVLSLGSVCPSSEWWGVWWQLRTFRCSSQTQEGDTVQTLESRPRFGTFVFCWVFSFSARCFGSRNTAEMVCDAFIVDIDSESQS